MSGAHYNGGEKPGAADSAPPRRAAAARRRRTHMANILTYLDWRGDLTLENAPFNEVDNLILAELSYLDFDGIVPPPEAMGEGVPLRWAAEEFFRRRGKKSTEIDMGVPRITVV